MVWRFRYLHVPGRRMPGGRLCLLILLLPTLVHFQLLGARLNGDGQSYYVFLRSMLKGGDFDLVEEYTHYGMIGRWDLAIPTRTGLRRSIYSVGPAVVWTPFFLLGEGVARVEGVLSGAPQDLSGYGNHHVNAVALGNLLYGFAALLLVHAALARHFPPGLALAAVLVLGGATFVYWYLVYQPTYAHNPSMLLSAYAVWLWDRDRQGEHGAWRSFFLGTILGLAMCVRWQNGVLLLLPGLDLVARLVRDARALPRLAGGAALLGLGVLIGAFPQMCAWKAMYGVWVLPCPPQGCDFLRLDHPWILETLFSSRHGLLSWTPALWLGYLGFVPLARRRPGLAATLAAPLVVMTYVNMCVADYWAGASFSNRRFDSVLPLLAFGVAAGLGAAWSWLRRRPTLGVVAAVVPFAIWNVAVHSALRQGQTAPDPTFEFARLAGAAAGALSDAAGFPTTWPASWLFAWSHRVSPGKYDLVVGRYLFYRQNSYGRRLDLTDPQVEPLLVDAWEAPTTVAGVAARCARGDVRILAPLDVAEPLELRFDTASPEGAQQAVVIGLIAAQEAWGRATFETPAGVWHREINEVSLGVRSAAGPLCVASAEFTPLRKRRPTT
jgi:multisubunit Na+/H+ antiporter MnhB subunit